MINNDGAIISECKIDSKLYSQTCKKYLFLSALIILLGVIGILIDVILSPKNPIILDIMMIVCRCIFCVFGAFLLGFYILQYVKSGSSQKSCVCRIYKEYMIVSQFDNGEKQSEVKVGYNTLLKSKETKDFFIAYANKTSFYPVCKEGLTTEEQNAVRKLFGLRILQGAGIADIAETSAPAENGENNDGSVNK